MSPHKPRRQGDLMSGPRAEDVKEALANWEAYRVVLVGREPDLYPDNLVVQDTIATAARAWLVSQEQTPDGFTYWTLTWGGLFDGRTAEDVTHLVRQRPNGGTPGPTLCGIDRFAKDGPGGSWHPTPRNPFGQTPPICAGCVAALGFHPGDKGETR